MTTTWWNLPQQIDVLLAGQTTILARLNVLQATLIKQGAKEMATLADIQTQVTQETTVVGSTVTLLQQLKQELDAALANGNMAAIQAISDQIGQNTQALANAVAANTPAQPTP